MANDLQRAFEEVAASAAARANEALHAWSPEGRTRRRRERERKRRTMAKIARRLIVATFAILLAGAAWGMIAPIGIMGALAVVVAVVLAWVAILVLSTRPAPPPQALTQSDLPQLPQRTEEWLAHQRPALPAPALRVVDGITARLDQLAPQLRTLDPATPSAQQLRKLVAEELPELIQGYQRVPASLRTTPRGGPAPDQQLVDGLGIVRTELDRMAADIAGSDLDRLATQNRYLELKYRGAGEDPR